MEYMLILNIPKLQRKKYLHVISDSHDLEVNVLIFNIKSDLELLL